jgi:osmotically-inducible protein OsmY
MSKDHDLQQAVLAALEFEPSVDAAHIGVAADDGMVTLTGHVWSYAQKQAAENAATGVRGVKAVVEEIEVRLPYGADRGDDEIARAAVQRLAWDVSLPAEGVRVKVEHGWITLSGEVDWAYQKEIATDDVRRLRGVVGVSNQIALRPGVDAGIISDSITHALHRSWLFDPMDIHVTAQAGRVRLTGEAPTPHDRRLAAATAWNTPGVVDVDNAIVVA